MITTGGTIGARCYGQDKTKVIDNQGMNVLELEIQRHPGVRIHRYSELSSLEMTPSQVLVLLRALVRLSSNDGVEGIVLTLGTDTMEEIVFLLDLFWPGRIPLVVTGSMRTLDNSGSDAPQNLADAIATARTPAIAALGVVVVFAGIIHAAARVYKKDPATLDAFSSVPPGRFGTVSKGVVTILISPEKRDQLDIEAAGRLEVSVPLVSVVSGDDGSTIRSVLAGRVDGLVVAGSGAGNVPRSVSSIIKSLPSEGIPVVIASRTGRPSIAPEIDPSPGRTELRQRGCFYALSLSPLKARLLLLCLIDMGADSAMMAARLEGLTEDPRIVRAMT